MHRSAMKVGENLNVGTHVGAWIAHPTKCHAYYAFADIMKIQGKHIQTWQKQDTEKKWIYDRFVD